MKFEKDHFEMAVYFLPVVLSRPWDWTNVELFNRVVLCLAAIFIQLLWNQSKLTLALFPFSVFVLCTDVDQFLPILFQEISKIITIGLIKSCRFNLTHLSQKLVPVLLICHYAIHYKSTFFKFEPLISTFYQLALICSALELTPSSFTETELMLSTRLLTSVILDSYFASHRAKPRSPFHAIITIFASLLWLVFLTWWLLHKHFKKSRTLKVLSSLLIFLPTIITFSYLRPSLKHHFVSIHHSTNYPLLLYCILVKLLFALILYKFRSYYNFMKNTNQRKFFHLLILILYLPPIAIDPAFLKACTQVAISLFVLIEFVRFTQLFGKNLNLKINTIFNKFMKGRDRMGTVVLSHIYLLFGCGFPLLINDDLNHLPPSVLLHPLLILGVGDSFASIVGSHIGKRKWPKTKKTIEGTLAGISSTLLAHYILSLPFNLKTDAVKLVIELTATFFLEAISDDLDNIILPIYSHTIQYALARP